MRYCGSRVDVLEPPGLRERVVEEHSRCTRQDRGASLGKITTDREIHDDRGWEIVYFSIRGYLCLCNSRLNGLSTATVGSSEWEIQGS